MKLEKKKAFAAKVLGVGRGKIVFNKTRLGDIKEAITRQDIRDLFQQRAISIILPNGRRTIVRKSGRRRAGSVRKRVVDSKREYIILTRKLRKYLMHLKVQGKISKEKYETLRKRIKARVFHSLSHMKEMEELK